MGVYLLMDNYADSTVYANYFRSSEDANFPGTNLLAKKRRAKMWRSAGYFNITSGSNTIVFQEDGATNRTATVAVAKYTSMTSLASAIQTAFNAAAGTATYTVLIDSTTGRFKIVSDGGGGATLDILWSTSTAMAGILGYNTTDDTGALTYTADSLKIATEEFLTFDLGLPTSIQAFAMIGPNNDPIKLSPSGTYKIQGNSTNSWSSPLYSATMTYNGNAIMEIDVTNGLDSGTKHRYWRVSISDTDNSNGYVSLNGVFLGKAFAPSEASVQFPLIGRLTDLSQNVVSESGSIISSNRPRTKEFNLTWFNLKKADIDELEDLFQIYGTSIPFYVSLDTNEVFSTSKQRRLMMVRFTSPPQYTLERPNIFNATMLIREEI